MTTPATPTLYAALLAAGVPIDNHESDLYFPVTEQSTAILAQYPHSKANATTFANQRPPNVGQRWYDVPFAFLPWWEARQPKKFPIILTSPDGQYFRRIHEDGRIEKKHLGMEWEANDTPMITPTALPGYLRTMTERLNWKQS